MADLTWKHSRSKIEAREIVKAELKKLGYQNQVTWNDFQGSVSIGWGTILNISGKITDELIILEKCKGVVSGLVLSECKVILQRLFPKN